MMPIPGYEDLPGYEAGPPLSDGDVVQVGDSRRGGHSDPRPLAGRPDLRHRRHLFCGDLLFHGSVGRTDFPGGDFGVLLSSIQKLVDAFPGSHRGPARATCSPPRWAPS